MKWTVDKEDVRKLINKNGDLCIQVLYKFYLEPNEKFYEKWYVETKRLKEKSKDKQVLTSDDFESTGEFINTPIHNHFIQLPYNVTDEFITRIGEQLYAIIKDYYDQGYYDNGELVYIPNTIPRYDLPTEENINECEQRIIEIKNNTLWQL